MYSRSYDNKEATVADLLGRTLASIYGMDKGSERIRFVCTDGAEFSMTYYDDCCASCSVEDVCGDVADLIGSPVVRAEEPSSLDKRPKKRRATATTRPNRTPGRS